MDVGETLVDEGRHWTDMARRPRALVARMNRPLIGIGTWRHSRVVAPADRWPIGHCLRLRPHRWHRSALSFAATPLPARSSSMSTPTRWLLRDALRCRVIQVC